MMAMEDRRAMAAERICPVNDRAMARVTRFMRALISLWLGLLFWGCTAQRYVIGNYPSKEQIAMMEIDGIGSAIGDYLVQVGATPPLENQLLFRALDGQNTKGLHFLSTEYMTRNPAGEIVDPWGSPYRIRSAHKMIIVSSANCKYTHRIKLNSTAEKRSADAAQSSARFSRLTSGRCVRGVHNTGLHSAAAIAYTN